MMIAPLNIHELHELRGAEKDFLEDTARKIEAILHDASNFAVTSSLNLVLTQRGLITTLAMTTARFAAASNKSQDEEAVSFAVTRGMAHAIFYVLAFSGENGLEAAPLVGWKKAARRQEQM